jgi:hypothetical protein
LIVEAFLVSNCADFRQFFGCHPLSKFRRPLAQRLTGFFVRALLPDILPAEVAAGTDTLDLGPLKKSTTALADLVHDVNGDFRLVDAFRSNVLE